MCKQMRGIPPTFPAKTVCRGTRQEAAKIAHKKGPANWQVLFVLFGFAPQPPRYAFLIASLLASSLPVPDSVTRPDSNT